MLTYQFQNEGQDGSHQFYHHSNLQSSICFEVNGVHHLHKLHDPKTWFNDRQKEDMDEKAPICKSSLPLV
jgi:hypothetical protein